MPHQVRETKCCYEAVERHNSGGISASIFPRKYYPLVVKHSHYRPRGPREFWEVKAYKFRDIGT
jgi:hypothetical protein